MQFYQLTSTVSEYEQVLGYFGTLAEAHAAGRSFQSRDSLRIECVEVPADKAGILNLLGCIVAREDVEVKVLRTWAFTARGGIREVPNGE